MSPPESGSAYPPLSPLEQKQHTGLGVSVSASGGLLLDQISETIPSGGNLPETSSTPSFRKSPLLSYEPQTPVNAKAEVGHTTGQDTTVTPVRDQQMYELQSDSRSPLLPQSVATQEPLPSCVYDLPFDVCKQRQRLDNLVAPKGALEKFGKKFKVMTGREVLEKDASLARFVSKRELVSHCGMRLA
jgi:hypothetical protein